VTENQQSTIQVEITIPRIVLPSPTKELTSGDDQTTDAMEQVQLLPLRQKKVPPSQYPQLPQNSESETKTYAAHQRLFHFFRIKTTVTAGQTYVLQILRRVRIHRPYKDLDQQSSLHITEKLSFTLDTTDSEMLSSEKHIVPGLNHIAIDLNENGVPSNYTIDGAEY